MRINDYVPTLGDDLPPSGSAWVEWIDSKLRAAFSSSAGRLPINDAHRESETGKELSVPFTGHLEVVTFLCPPTLTVFQASLLLLKYRDGYTYPEIADRLGSDSTGRLEGNRNIYRIRDEAFERLIRRISGNPYYRLTERL